MNFKNFLLSIVSAIALIGCHSNPSPANNQQDNSNNNVTLIDTSHMQVPQQPIDTSIRDGLLTKRYQTGIISEKSYYVAGRRQGECQSFYPSGKMWSDDFFTNGLHDGATTTYYENGQKRYEGMYVNGKPSGIWNFYDNTGKLVRKANYGKK